MLLTIDLGNTNLTIGLYEGETLANHWRLATDQARMPDEYGLQLLGLLTNAGRTPADLTGVCLSSVVPPLTGRVTQACREYLHQEALVVDTGIKTGIRIRYEDPKAVGADRVCDAVAVMHLYGGPACIIDFGTATTFNALTKEGDYLGGAITAGINLAAEALFAHGAKLQRIDLQKPPSVIGHNTTHAMQSGLIYGYVSMVEGMVDRFREELGPEMKVIATGGLAGLIARETPVIQVYAPWLTLDGLRLIWDLNQVFNSMTKYRILFTLLLLLVVACTAYIPANTGVQGQVLIGPMCPVVQINKPCPDRPYPAPLTILTADGKKVKSFNADGEGRFLVALAPGSYILRPENPANVPLPVAPEQPFSVVAGQYTQLKVSYDSGIR